MYPGTHARRTPDKPAVVMAGSGRVVTYRQLDDESVQVARALRAAGLRRGDAVAILMGNHARYLTMCWAAHRIGLRYVPLNWHLTTDELRYIVDDCAARVLVADDTAAEAAVTLRTAPGLLAAWSVEASLPGFDDIDAVIEGLPGGPLDDESEGIDMVYTSGTTGRPKGGKRPLPGGHPGDGADTPPLLLHRLGIDERAVFLTPGAPLYHAAPLRFARNVTRVGATNVILERFDAEAALAAIERHGVTHSQWVPTMFVRMLRLPEEVRSRYDLSSHRGAVHSAAPCPMSVKQQMIDWWGPLIDEYYGGSEGGGATYITAAEWLAHRGSVGRPFVGTFHILDEEGRELAPREEGVVHVEGGIPFEYHNDAEKTARAHSPQGWTTVGDIGYLDEEGYLYLTDRKDHTIVSGGVNIYPQESENLLIEHPAVADVAVIGVPNEEFGEEVKAVVELVDPGAASDALADELLRFCRERLAGYKCPRSVDFEAHLPRAPSGKLYKRRLRDRYWEGHSTRIV